MDKEKMRKEKVERYFRFIKKRKIFKIPLVVIIFAILLSIITINYLKNDEITKDCLERAVSSYCINKSYTHYNTEIEYPKKGYVLFKCSSEDDGQVKIRGYVVNIKDLNIKEHCQEDEKKGEIKDEVISIDLS